MSNVPVFVGLDYHQDSIQVCVLNQKGDVLLNRSAANNYRELERIVAPLGVVQRVGIEACCGAADLGEELVERLGWNVSLGHPAYVARLRCLTLVNETGQTVRLLTSLLDVPARIIGLIYRWRWQIELFFRWLKTFAKLDHLISHNRNGITLQFYVAVIGMLLIYIKTGRKPDKYSLILLQHVAGGASMESLLPWLEERWREKDLAAARRARKAAKKT
jgi:hypothetical protein